jgi:hypothetical protein
MPSPIEVKFSVPAHLAPALRSAVELVSNAVGEKLTYPMGDKTGQAAMTQSYTDAAIALGLLRKACSEAISRTNPHIS